MKKLLSLLSVLTIGGTAVPTTIAASPYQKEEKLNKDINYLKKNNLKRYKRNMNDNKDEVEFSDPIFGKPRFYFTFMPNTFEEIIFWKLNDNLNDFIAKFENKFYPNAKLNDARIGGGHIRRCAETIWNNWSTIYDFWQNSFKNLRIKIVTVYLMSEQKENLESVEFRTDDTKIYYNNNFTKLQEDFTRPATYNFDIKGNEFYSGNIFKDYINLGLVDNSDNSSILNRLKAIYVNVDISQLEINNISDFSHFSKGYFAKIKVKNNSKKYSIGILKPKFIFNTKIKISEINNYILNDNKVKQWIEHLNDWSNDVNSEIKNVPKKTIDQKMEWINRKKEDLKTYIRDWNYIINLLEHDLKLEELNNAIEGVRQDINNLKLNIDKINKMILSIQNSSIDYLSACSNIGGIIAASTAWLPAVGTLISTISGTVAAVCAINNV